MWSDMIETHQVSKAKYSSDDECGQDAQIASTIVGGGLTGGIVSYGSEQVGDIRQAQGSQDGINTCIHHPLSSHTSLKRCSDKILNCSAVRLPSMLAATYEHKCWACKMRLDGQNKGVTCCQHGLQEWGVQGCHMSCLAGKQVVDDVVHKGQQPKGLHTSSGFESGLL